MKEVSHNHRVTHDISHDLVLIVDGIGLALIAACTFWDGIEVWESTYQYAYPYNIRPIILCYFGRFLQISGLIFLIGIHFSSEPCSYESFFYICSRNPTKHRTFLITHQPFKFKCCFANSVQFDIFLLLAHAATFAYYQEIEHFGMLLLTLGPMFNIYGRYYSLTQKL